MAKFPDAQVVRVRLIFQFSSSAKVFVPSPFEGGGEEVYTPWVFFVQTILADRYIDRSEM